MALRAGLGRRASGEGPHAERGDQGWTGGLARRAQGRGNQAGSLPCQPVLGSVSGELCGGRWIGNGRSEFRRAV